MKGSVFVRALVLSVGLTLVAGGVFAGGQKDTPAAEHPSAGSRLVNVAALNGPSGIPMAYLFENAPVVAGAEFDFQVVAGADVLLPKLLKGEVDVGILPPNVAAKVFTQNNGAIVAGAVVGQGMLSLITRDGQVDSLSDLRGKTVSVAGQGATPEYLFRYLLQANGISVSADGAKPGAESVALDFSIPAAEIAAALLSGKVQYAVVPEPFSTVATAKDASVRKAINLQDEYRAVMAAEGRSSTNFPMTVVVVRKDFARTSPNLVRGLLAAYQEAVDWTVENPAEAGRLVERHTLGLQAPVAAKVIPNGAYVFVSATEARPELEELYSIFLDFAPESIGGQLPGNDFYFE